jgi:ribosomal protein S18 acetylase RimI-like enzyme
MIEVRAARLDDADDLVALIDAAAAALTAKLGPGYWSKRASLRRMRERITDSDPAMIEKAWFVAEQGGVVVAVIALATRPFRSWKKQLWARPDQPALGVFDLAVHPAAQRRGVGRALMRFAERTARTRGLPWVRLDAFAENPESNAFYRGIGYDERGEVSASGVALVLYERAVTSRRPRPRRAPRAPRSS